MGTDLYLDPTWGLQEWDALMWCDVCEEDTEQQFAKHRAITYALCPVCDTDTEIDPDWEE